MQVQRPKLAAFLSHIAGRGLIAVSGGPDSVALLRLVHAAGRDVHVAHVNHGLRGAESDADEAFVRDLAEQLGVPCTVARLPPSGRSAVGPGQSRNLEAAARRLRYAWLAELARQIGATWVATGHTADDQAETVLFHLLRGTGLRGLRGIAPRRLLAPGVELVRPLLAQRRADLRAWLHELGQTYRTDSSNNDPRFTRNRLRLEVLPLLTRTVHAHAVEHLARLAAQARQVQRELTRQARRLLGRCERPRAGEIVILDRQHLGAQSQTRVTEMLLVLFDREGWPRGRMTMRLWQQAAAVCRGKAAAMHLPGGLMVRSAGSVVQIGPRLPQDASLR